LSSFTRNISKDEIEIEKEIRVCNTNFNIPVIAKMGSVINIIKAVQGRIKNRTVLLSVSHGLEKLGIKIVPYYLTLESLSGQDQPELRPEFESVVCGFLSQSEIDALYAELETRSLRAEIAKWKEDNCLCFGMKHDGSVVAYVWCNLRRCNSDFSFFTLQQDEAYLFRARTMKAYRGSNLTPLLRYKLYQSLVEMGRVRYYSVTEYFNTPAANFKKKLKAEHIKLCLYFGLFGKIKCNITLKEYRK
jgi:hypothetical protein